MNLLKTVTSQLKVRFETPLNEIESRTVKKASCFRNEPFSFQVLYRFTDVTCWKPVSISVKTTLPIQVYRVDYASVTNAANDHKERGYVGNEPGLYPNPLMPRSAVPELCTLLGENKYEKGEMYRLDADPNFRSLWVSINPYSADVASGIYDIEIELLSLETGKSLEKESFTLEVMDALLPPHDLYYTNWFHVDCLCDYYGVEPYTDEFYGYFESFIKNASMHRQNTLLIPAFTPALDTPVGGERRNVQLVDIEVKDGGYVFGFEKLERFLRVADSCGIAYFEHCHLFSQWGAKSAPNIYDIDGKRIFGWETSSQSGEYCAFLKAYLTELLKFADRAGYGERFIFHLSDEPPKDDVESFAKATEVVRDILKGKTVADALSYIDYYRRGIITTPVAFMPHAEEFSAECKDFWLYYTCGTYAVSCANRLITTTSARTRVLGLQLYYYGAGGFLHWGYNYYYNVLSTGFFDPMANPCGYKNVPGASYLAYPTRNGAVPSVCEKLMCEAFDDVRALKLLESHIGKKAVVDFCEKVLNETVNYTLIPEKEEMFVLRQRINEEIKKYI